jgi:hypothetical protein
MAEKRNILCAALICAGLLAASGQALAQSPGPARIVRRDVAADKPLQHETIFSSSSVASGIYLDKMGGRVRSGDYISPDNGKTWEKRPMTPDLMAGLPKGYRRNPVTSVMDHRTGRLVTIVNSLDVKDLDPNINEPPIALNTYYLRYRVSEDKGMTWKHEEPIILKGPYDARNPMPGIEIGKNSIFLGDLGCNPIVSRKGRILVPAQATLLGEDGKLANPGKGYTYTDVIVLIGKWKKDGKLEWTMGQRVQADPKRSSRGMIEPTMVEMKDGRILMVMRGSNEVTGVKTYDLPAYKWASVSKDGGRTWTAPEPFTYEDGTNFYSPSAMSTLFRHSSGRCFWFGNMTSENARGNLPRWPLVMAEVNTGSLKLMKSTVLVLDTQREEDRNRGRLDISHFSMIEDRETGEIILTYPRSYQAYKEQEWVTMRIAID